MYRLTPFTFPVKSTMQTACCEWSLTDANHRIMPKNGFWQLCLSWPKWCQDVILTFEESEESVVQPLNSFPSLVLFSSRETVLMNSQCSILKVEQPLHMGALGESRNFLERSLSWCDFLWPSSKNWASLGKASSWLCWKINKSREE